jgi:hypothetical protein
MARRFGLSTWPTGVSALIVVMLVHATGAIAGQEAAGIVGRVTDASGAILPGVTVTATSPALQVPQVTAVTTEQGDYRLAPLPIGTYSLEYSLPGFQLVRHEGVRLTVPRCGCACPMTAGGSSCARTTGLEKAIVACRACASAPSRSAASSLS